MPYPLQAVPTLELLQLGEMGHTPAATAASSSSPAISHQQQQQHQGPGSGSGTDVGGPGVQYIDFKALLQVFRTAQLRSYQMYVVQRQPPPLIPTGASGLGVTFGGGPGAGAGAMDGSWAMAAGGGGGMAVAAVGRGVGGSAGGGGGGWQEQQVVMAAPGVLGAGTHVGVGVSVAGVAEGAQQVQEVQQLEQRFDGLQVQEQGGVEVKGEGYEGQGEWEGQREWQGRGQGEEDVSPQAQMEAVQAAEVTRPEQQGQRQEPLRQLNHGGAEDAGQQWEGVPLGQPQRDGTGFGQGQGAGQGQEVDLLMLLGDDPSPASFRQHTPPAFAEQEPSFAGGGGGRDNDFSS